MPSALVTMMARHLGPQCPTVGLILYVKLCACRPLGMVGSVLDTDCDGSKPTGFFGAADRILAVICFDLYSVGFSRLQD